MSKIDTIKRTVVFILGIILVLDAILGIGTNITEIVIGLLLMGIIPLDLLANRRGKG